MFKDMGQEIEQLIKVALVTENEQDAKLLVEVFLRAYGEDQRREILKELEKRDSRFKGWNSDYTFEYSYQDVTGDTLYIGRKVARLIKEQNLKIKVFLYQDQEKK